VQGIPGVRDRRDDTGCRGFNSRNVENARKKRGLLDSGHLEKQPSRVASARRKRDVTCSSFSRRARRTNSLASRAADSG